MEALRIERDHNDAYAMNLSIEFQHPADLRPSEEHNEGRVAALVKKIEAEGVWTLPVLVEQKHKVIMDGHHRVKVAQALRLDRIPVVMLLYGDDRLTVTSWSDESPYDTSLILAAGRAGHLLPYKSTRHILTEGIPACHFPLFHLRS